MTKEQAIERLKIKLDNDKKYLEQCNPFSDLVNEVRLDNKSIEIVLSMLEEKEKIIGLYIDNIMTHQQVKTIRKMCCPSCPIGEKACTYSGIHRNCIKQYFENKAKELLNK